MVILTSVFSIGLVVIGSRVLNRVAPSVWVPIAFGLSAVFLVVEWMLTTSAPGPASRLLYLQISGLGPMLGSGFWLMMSERFDPYTAKKRFGQIAAAGTFGGLVGGLISGRVSALWGVGAVLPLLATANLVCAWQTRQLGNSSVRTPRSSVSAGTPDSPLSGLRVLTNAKYLRTLAMLVFLGTVAAGAVNQAFNTRVKAAIDKDSLGTFFSRYYTALSLMTFLVQAGASRFALERLGLGAAAGTPAATFLAGGTATLLAPGLSSIVLTRWSEQVLRGSIYRAGYEIFYTPISSQDKRAVKSIIDVGVDRTGDIIGASLVKQLLWIPQPRQTTVLMTIGMACSAAALFVASRLKRGYTETLEKSLLSHAVELDLSEVKDLTTKTTMLKTLGIPRVGPPGASRAPASELTDGSEADAPVIRQIQTLQSGDRGTIGQILRAENGLPKALVAHVIPLLASDDDAMVEQCVRALRGVAEERVGELLDALLDPNQPFPVRRRLARSLSVCVSQRAADGLLLGLEDQRFEVRFQCGRSLLAINERNPRVRIDPQRVLAVVRKEVSHSRDVWRNRHLLDGPGDDDDRSFLETLLRDRASESLAHVFTLLALVLPTEPLRVSFRGLHTDDQALRGTALEYLEGVLPSDIRQPLWPFLEDRRPKAASTRSHEEALDALLRSHQSIQLNLESLQKRTS